MAVCIGAGAHYGECVVSTTWLLVWYSRSMRSSVNIHLLIDTTVLERELERGTLAISRDWGPVSEMHSVLLMTLQRLMDEHLFGSPLWITDSEPLHCLVSDTHQ